MPERNLREHDSQYAVLAMARGMLTVGLILGVLIIIGGRERWSSPSFEAALSYPYAPASWGWVLGVACLAGLGASLLAKLRLVAAMLFVVAVWSLFFCWSFIDTAAGNQYAATTGIPVYFGYAVGSIVLAAVHWRSSRNALHR